MTDLSEHFLSLKISEQIFKDIKYFITGEVHEKIESFLKAGGAEHQKYISDYVTHLIVGNNPEENDIAEANDLYEIPAVTPKWILMCVSLKHRLDAKPYLYPSIQKLFTGYIFCFSKIVEDRNDLWGLITYNGGLVYNKLNKHCSFLVTGVTNSVKYQKAESLGPENIKIVTPDWILEAVRTKSLPDPILFHPKLINWPKPPKPQESTTAITGFDPDTPENEEKSEEKTIPDSTQALLEKLKQRMPWNQPPAPVSTSASSNETIAPPNVVAPSFLNKLQNNQNTQNIRSATQQISISQASMLSGFPSAPNQSSNQVPRSVVHHAPNSQQTVLQQNINRLIGNSVTRPTSLQPLKGQLNTSQIHQQLLQQRIQQQTQQNIIQRTSTGQLNVNQQLLHQQLSQGQRQVLQNHLIGQQGLLNQQLLSQQGVNQIQTGQKQTVDSQNQQNQVLGQQIQQNQQCSPSSQLNNQQNLLNQQNQLNQQMQVQNQVMSIQQQNQLQISQQQMLNQNQSTNQIINQQQSQLINQASSQSQQLQNQLLSQSQGQNQQNILLSQQQSSLLGQTQIQNQQNQLINQNQIVSQSQTQNQQNQLINPSQGQLINQPQVSLQSHLIGQATSQKQLINSQQAQNQLINHQNQLLNQQLQQTQLLNQQSQLLSQSQQNQLLNQQTQFLNQQNQLLNQQNSNQVSQSSQMINQNQIINQQTQQMINQETQHQPNQQNIMGLSNLSQNQHLNQLSPQQIQQLQQLKREQLNQNQTQNVGGLNQGNISLNQQRLSGQNQNQQMIGQGQQMVNQQLIGQPQLLQNNRVMQQQNINQSMNQNFQQGLNQHMLSQKQQLLVQQQINTSQQQQIIQNQGNLTTQQQFISQTQFENIQPQKLNQNGQNQINQTTINQMNVQALNQQLNSQNLGQQLNQQLMQQNQQTGLSQGSINQQNINQGIGMEQGINQNIGVINQQAGLSQSGLNSQPTLGQQQSLNQLSQQNQMNQINSGMSQQVIRGQFPQQMLVNQGQQNQQTAVPRPQLNQPQIWTQQQGTPIQGQQIIRHPVNVAVQQSSAGGNVGPRIQWPPGQQPGMPQRQFIQLDAQTHNQLQKMPPDQQALFVARLQKQRQLQLAKQGQQRAGGPILIRGNVPPGLTTQQQVQWLQQQAKQQGIVLPPNLQQNITPGTLAPQGTSTQVPQPPHTPSLSPINQNAGQQFVGDQVQLRQYKLQQLQLQREQAQKNHLNQQGPLTPQPTVRPIGQPAAADSTTNPQVQVNPKTKTALANMLSIKLQSGGTIGAPPRPEGLPEPSAAGTLRMMTAQHNAAINSKPQEIIALQHRRVISGPNGEIIKPPGVPTLPLTPQNEPPKLQFNQKPAIPVQHRAGPFYGHNPNLKLPPDLFLLGCIFVVVEVEEYLEQNLPGWQQKIETYGGEVEKQYCSRVTHVLCETQRHGVVMQALRDLKRCVTIRWLSDVIKTKQVLPPWTALHLPQIYLDITPASKHLISISGFEGNIRQIVKQMIRYTGAKCTTYFSKHNTLLICSKAEGKKYSHAKKWGIPVVNVQWLTDIILGNFTAMNQMDNQAYQTYSNPPNLSFDPKLVPNMMLAWKAPINISQELYERVKRSASPVLPKAKKPKTEHTDENENITEITNSAYKVIFSQFESEKVKELEKIVRELGGGISKDYKEFSHLVVPKIGRTHKLLFAITKSCHIVTQKWLEDSLAARNFLPENDFIPPMEEFNGTYNVYLERTLQTFNRNKLLEGKIFWTTPSVFPTKKIICDLIEASGGKLERIRRSKAQIEATSAASPLTYFILTAKEDLHLVADLLKNKKEKQKIVCNVELVLSAILKQQFEVEPYAVSVV